MGAQFCQMLILGHWTSLLQQWNFCWSPVVFLRTCLFLEFISTLVCGKRIPYLGQVWKSMGWQAYIQKIKGVSVIAIINIITQASHLIKTILPTAWFSTDMVGRCKMLKGLPCPRQTSLGMGKPSTPVPGLHAGHADTTPMPRWRLPTHSAWRWPGMQISTSCLSYST